MRAWLRSIDWADIVGSGFALAFGLLIFVPLVSQPPKGAAEPSYQNCPDYDDYVKNSCASGETFWQRTTHDPVAFFTSWLAIFSGLLTVVSFVQIRFLIRADQTARISADAALAAVEAARIQSEEAGRATALTGRQADILEKQAAIARLQFVADKRPRLHIRNIAIDHPTPATKHVAPWFVAGHQITGSLVLVNLGGTEARIIDSRYRFFWTPAALPMDLSLDEDSLPLDDTGEMKLQAGESCSIPIRSASPMDANADNVHFYRAGWKIYLIGFVHYADISYPPIERFMGFCRVFDARRFRIVDDPDYEYQD